MNDLEEGSPEGVPKTTTLEFKNPEHPEAIHDDEHENYWEKFSNYDDVRTIREDYAVSLKELFGEYAIAVNQTNAYMDDEERDLSLVHGLTDIAQQVNKKTRLTDWKKHTYHPTKTTAVSYQNPKHPETYVDEAEEQWYNAIDSIRDSVANDIYYPFNTFAKAVVMVVEEDDMSLLEEQIDTLLDGLE